MSYIIDLANTVLQPLINLGAAPLMTIILTVIALLFRVKFTKALEGGIKLGIALTGVGAIMNILTGAFSNALGEFVANTGLNLNVTDVGWAPLATITWGSPYTLYFMLILLIVNGIMLALNKTNTLDVDIFDIWHLSIVGLFAMYMGANLLVTTLLVVFIGVLKIINSDLMKPTFNDLLNAPDENPMTTTHMNYMMNPIIMLLDKIYDKLFSWLDKYDFDAAKLNSKIGFWGSKFAIGIYLGIFVGLLAGISIQEMLTLGFTAAVCLELFSVIGQWFIASVEPLSQGVTDFTSKKFSDRTFNIGLDWPFIAGRAEIWAVANVLAPIMLIEALILPNNGLLPLGGIIAMGLTPALLVVTRGKIIRMIVIGTVLLPTFLYSGTLIAPFVTETAKQVGAFPADVASNSLISHTTLEGPIEKFVAYFVGQASQGDIEMMIYAALAIALYLILFVWYAKQMQKRNAEYAKKG
ncbi:PTS glucitol transporter subunit IIA [Aerococcus viridans]|uniref:PTS glucitol transporter subunit IIA n=1 Tax=Aerococcus viridans TaxID=1377 RepID=A0A2N6UFE5_9LACT|nr:PTS transporter subunit IIC [Aerococcus viridans]PMC80265.1 PTS glucitol transporter subunit IIA [Aerococcus viridans]